MTIKSRPTPRVIPAKAGIQFAFCADGEMDPRFRGDDTVGSRDRI